MTHASCVIYRRRKDTLFECFFFSTYILQYNVNLNGPEDIGYFNTNMEDFFSNYSSSEEDDFIELDISEEEGK